MAAFHAPASHLRSSQYFICQRPTLNYDLSEEIVLHTCAAVVVIRITAANLDLLPAIHACVFACLQNSITLAAPFCFEPAYRAGSLFLNNGNQRPTT
jgi:hypothetical protein